MSKKGEFPFAEPLTSAEARCLLAHLPKRGASVGRSVKEDENPILYLALWKLEWLTEKTP